MLILLPPSETKTRPGSGDPVQLQELSLPQLDDDRLRVLAALEKVSGQRNALEALGVRTVGQRPGLTHGLDGYLDLDA